MTDFRNRAFQFFSQNGWSPHAAAALAGNGQWESGGSPTITDPRGEGSVGIYQWRLDRRDALNRFANSRGMDPMSEATQLAFAQHELGNNESKWGEALKSAKDLGEANNAVLGYLRPAGWTEQNPMGGHGYVQRYNEAAPLVNASPMAQALAMPPTRNVGFGPQPAMQQPQQPQDNYADMVGYGGSPPPAGRVWDEGKQPVSAFMKPAELTKFGMGLLASGSPQQTMQPMQVPMGQAYRGNPAALSLLDSLTKRGLLG